MQDASNSRRILVLQSDLVQGQLIQEVLAEHELQPQIEAIAHSQTALAYLQRQEPFTTAQRPDLILLDLDLTGELSGRDLLAHIKADASLRRIPIIVLTLSSRTEDILHSYALQGNCYVIRPGDRDQLTQIIRRIEEFWLKIVTLPSE